MPAGGKAARTRSPPCTPHSAGTHASPYLRHLLPPAAALCLRGEGTALNFDPAHFCGVAQALAGHGLDAVVAALRVLSRGGPAARQQSSRFRGVSRHQKVCRVGWGRWLGGWLPTPSPAPTPQPPSCPPALLSSPSLAGQVGGQDWHGGG